MVTGGSSLSAIAGVSLNTLVREGPIETEVGMEAWPVHLLQGIVEVLVNVILDIEYVTVVCTTPETVLLTVMGQGVAVTTSEVTVLTSEMSLLEVAEKMGE